MKNLKIMFCLCFALLASFAQSSEKSFLDDVNVAVRETILSQVNAALTDDAIEEQRQHLADLTYVCDAIAQKVEEKKSEMIREIRRNKIEKFEIFNDEDFGKIRLIPRHDDFVFKSKIFISLEDITNFMNTRISEGFYIGLAGLSFVVDKKVRKASLFDNDEFEEVFIAVSGWEIPK